jgi:hypothetical protein
LPTGSFSAEPTMDDGACAQYGALLPAAAAAAGAGAGDAELVPPAAAAGPELLPLPATEGVAPGDPEQAASAQRARLVMVAAVIRRTSTAGPSPRRATGQPRW